MPNYVISPPPQVAVPVLGGGLFPVRRVYCVGRNYAEHAREMGHDPNAEPPFFFAKPADALVLEGAPVAYPSQTANFHHEIELVAAIGTGGKDISVEAAMAHVWGYAAGIDLTRRDLQAEAKRLGRPWDTAKGFDASAPVGAVVPAAQVDPTRGAVTLRVDGELRQAGDLADQIWSVAETVAELSRYVRLAPGDLLFTGTPDGVGPVRRGALLEGAITGVGTVTTRIR